MFKVCISLSLFLFKEIYYITVILDQTKSLSLYLFVKFERAVYYTGLMSRLGEVYIERCRVCVWCYILKWD